MAPLLLEGVLGASAHVPFPVALAAAAVIGVYLLVFAAREHGRNRPV
jgi:hypothetical protein